MQRKGRQMNVFFQDNLDKYNLKNGKYVFKTNFFGHYIIYRTKYIISIILLIYSRRVM
jgi:hypothetical protein